MEGNSLPSCISRKMTYVLTAEAPDSESAYARLVSWARANRLLLDGDACQGRVRRDPHAPRSKFDLARFFFPRLSGRYTVRRADVTIVMQGTLYPGLAETLREAGFLGVRSRGLGQT